MLVSKLCCRRYILYAKGGYLFIYFFYLKTSVPQTHKEYLCTELTYTEITRLNQSVALLKWMAPKELEGLGRLILLWLIE